jgi:uncharacterized membrane protein YqjE
MSHSNHTSLFGSLRRLGGAALATAHNRVALFAVELQEEKCRLIQALLLAAASIALGVTALTLVTITIVVLFWENGRVPALCVLSGFFIAATVVVIRSLKKLLAEAPGFSGTLGELQKDRTCSLLPK